MYWVPQVPQDLSPDTHLFTLKLSYSFMLTYILKYSLCQMDCDLLSSVISLWDCRVSSWLHLCLPGFYCQSGSWFVQRMWLSCLFNGVCGERVLKGPCLVFCVREIRTWKTLTLSPSNDWLIPQPVHEESSPVSPKGPPQRNSQRTWACCTACCFRATALPDLIHTWSFLPGSVVTW